MPDAIHPRRRKLRIPPLERFDRAVEFVRHDLKTPLWGKQAQILRAIKRNRRTAVRSCNGSGKTFVAATAVIWWLMAHPNEPAMVVTTAPTQHQVRDLLWREIRALYYRNAALIGGVLNKTTLELSPKHYATGLSTDSPERFQGFHETNILFVVDEASGVREEVFDAIEGSMTSRRARLLLIGNPTSLAGTFYKAFHQRRTQYKTIHISAFDTPNLVGPATTASRAKSSQSRDLGQGREFPTPAEGPSVGLGGVLPCSPSQTGRELEGGSLASDTDYPVVDTDAQSTPDTVEHSREAAQEPPQTGPNKPIPGILTQKWVEEASTTWSKNSAQYQVRVLGQFPKEADDTLIPLTSIEAAISPNRQSDPTPAHRARHNAPNAQHCHAELDSVSIPRAHNSDAANNLDLTQPIHIGVDVARFGTDRTVICVRQGNHVLALNQHQKLNTMRTTGLVVNAIQKYNPQTVNIDEIGIGAGVLDRLHELGYNDPTGRSVLPRTGGARGGDLRRATKSSDDARSNAWGDSEPSRPTTSATNAIGINVGNKATDPEHFFNLRSELYDNLRARFEEQTIVIPNDDDLIGQLAAIRVEYTSRGQLKVEPKETMRRRSLPSPDKADALLLAFAPTRERPPFEVWV